MATHATIQVGHKRIYVHSDGYPSHTGRMLLSYYYNRDKAEELIALGNLSQIAERLDAPIGHRFDHPVRGHCVAYHRDRGEKKEYWNDQVEQYNYIWDDKSGMWYVYQERQAGKWHPLTWQMVETDDIPEVDSKTLNQSE